MTERGRNDRPEARFASRLTNADAMVLDWINPPVNISRQGGASSSFSNATLNACFNCLDRHVRAGRGAQAAIIYDAPVIAFEKTISYEELLDEVTALAAVLDDFGVGKGDRVLLYLPMIPRTHVAMLACARIGAISVLVPDAVGSDELTRIIDDAEPKLVLTASCAIVLAGCVALKPMLDAAIDRATAKPRQVLVWQRPRLEAALVAGRDHDWEVLVDAVEDADGRTTCVAVAASEPLAFSYAGNATGILERVVHDTALHLVLSAKAMHDTGIVAGDVFWASARVTEPLGQICGVYGPLLIGATTVCYEGEPVGTPDAAAFWRVCEQWRVAALLAAPKAIRMIKDADPTAAGLIAHDLDTLRAIYLDATATEADTAEWLSNHVKMPVVDQWHVPDIDEDLARSMGETARLA